MAKFERPRERNDRNARSSSPRRSYGGRDSFEDRPKREYRRAPSREPRYNNRKERDFKMTKVICSSCGDECEVPFKPTSSKPVYCDNCFVKKDKAGSDKSFSKDFETINEKLDKIIKALNIK
jgi:CxxC-x17-CxxC domain-containing protein